ncbi:hypothetical protein F5148DRAFT_1262075 [Russula earlei]|uniref:Uncharacterized protein n=1 Tax=Russula earlei TaxID=71964 RepID=A0ACC0TRX0_9AGAM|nr:hypothetical protein F5148DRAFT_1262075 [Russula earlei]
MKKILFGSSAAICTVVGLSSFKTANTGNFAWFGVNALQNIPASDGQITTAEYGNGDFTFLGTSPAEIDNDCGIFGGSQYCVFGIDTTSSNVKTAGSAHVYTLNFSGSTPIPVENFDTRPIEYF